MKIAFDPWVLASRLRYHGTYVYAQNLITQTSDLRSELSRKGKVRAETFGWAQCARETVKIFQREMRNGRK